MSDTEYLKATTETKPTVSNKPTEPKPASVRTNTRENPVDYNLVTEEFRENNISKAKNIYNTIMFHNVS